jgi:hypothetical protein
MALPGETTPLIPQIHYVEGPQNDVSNVLFSEVFIPSEYDTFDSHSRSVAILAQALRSVRFSNRSWSMLAAARELITYTAYEQRRTLEEASGMAMGDVLCIVIFILAVVGLDTVVRCARRLPRCRTSTRSIGVQTQDILPVPLLLPLQAQDILRPLPLPVQPQDILNFSLETMTVEQLKGLCRDRKLLVGGSKRDLVSRLTQRTEAANI